MSWNKFFLDWKKILITIILILITSSIPNLFISGADIGINYGFPFNFYGHDGGPGLLLGQPVPVYFHYETIVEDIIIWYLFSCLIIWIFDKVKKKK